MRRKRVLWLSHLLPWPPKGGLQQRSYHLFRELARYHDVALVAFWQDAHQPDVRAVRDAVQKLSECGDVLHVERLLASGSSWTRNRLALKSLFTPGYPFTVNWGRSRSFANAVEYSLSSYSPDVIHVDTVSLAQYLNGRPRVCAVLNHHNIESHMLLRRATKQKNPAMRAYFWQEGKRLQQYERRIAKLFRLHLVCSDLDGQRLSRIAGKVNHALVPNGVDLAYFHPQQREVQPYTLVFVGGLTWYPNIDAIRWFIRTVWPRLCGEQPEFEFRIIGRNPPSDLVRAAEKDPRIKLFGYVDDIRPIVGSSALYVCPISDGGGTKLKMLDAMAMGKAIVAHPVACEGLSTVNGEHVVEASTPEEFANAVLRLIRDSALRKKLEANARDHVMRNFSFSEIGKRLSRCYSELS